MEVTWRLAFTFPFIKDDYPVVQRSVYVLFSNGSWYQIYSHVYDMYVDSDDFH